MSAIKLLIEKSINNVTNRSLHLTFKLGILNLFFYLVSPCKKDLPYAFDGLCNEVTVFS